VRLYEVRLYEVRLYEVRLYEVCYSRMNGIMIPPWFPWIFVGGLVFIVLSFIAAKYKDKSYRKIQLLQDFISGSILIAFTGVLMPDFFPIIDIPTGLPSSFGSSGGGVFGNGELDLQVGPPRLAGR
jgi:hypothetical protein